MGNTGKWLRIFMLGKKDKERCNVSVNPTIPITVLPAAPKEKKRWSFRRSSATAGGGAKDSKCMDGVALGATPAITSTPQTAVQAMLDGQNEKKKHALAVAAATAAAADAAVAAAQAAAEVIRLTIAANGRASAVEVASAVKIQSVFRSYLARKALSALKGLVKLQALVRGHLVRKQATVTLRCMQALVTVQARARAQRIRMAEEGNPINHRPSTHRKSTTRDNKIWNSYNDMDRGSEDNIKIVEMDLGVSKVSIKSRKSYSNSSQIERAEPSFSTNYPPQNAYSKQDDRLNSSVPSAITDMSPRASSGYFEEYSYTTAHSSPQHYSAMSKPDPSRIPFSFHRPEYAESLSNDYPFYPSYMANTESSRAKVRSQSAPKQRPDSFERQPSRRRLSMEGRNIPRSVKMQRSSSHVGAAVQGYQYPWSIKLDKSSASIKDSECGSTSTVLTNTNYCRSLVSYDPQGRRY